MSRRAHWLPWAVGVLMMTVGPVILIGAGLGLTPSDVLPGSAEEARSLPAGWEPFSLAAAYDETRYDLVGSERGPVVRARSTNASSGLALHRRIDLTAYPILEWSWKIERILSDGRVGNLGHNDAPARVIVTFDYRDLSLLSRLRAVAFRALGYDIVPKRAIFYLWASRVEQGTVVPNPYLPWMEQVVVRSGSTQAGTWVTERRNVLADYREIFGEEPPPVERIGLMTDTNNTGGTLTSYFGTILMWAASSDSAAVDTLLHVSNHASGNE